MKRFLGVLMVCACLCLTAGPASALSLFGEAGQYNLVVFGDAYVKNSDVQGSAAIGGDANFKNYGVATRRSGNNANLVVAGDLTFKNGQVGINASGTIYAGSADLTNTNPSIYESYSSALINFGTTAALLEDTSLSLSTLSATGTTQMAYGTITLKGASADLNVFDLSGSDLSKANNLIIDAPTGSTVVVNVDGSEVDVKNMGFQLVNVGNSTVLYNLFEATGLDISGVGVQGSILAPYAAVDFSNGNIDGQLIVSSLGTKSKASTGELHDVVFSGSVPVGDGGGTAPVPEPATLLLLGTGMAGLASRRLIRKK